MSMLLLVLVALAVAVIAVVCSSGFSRTRGCGKRRRCCRSSSSSSGGSTGGAGGLDLSTYTELTELEVRQITDQNRPGSARTKPRVKMQAADGIEFTASSSNWCGYVQASSLTAPAAGAFSGVGGTWNVPSVVATAGQAATYVAFWIGTDGGFDNTVEQLGTEQDVINGVVSAYAWFELYPGGAYEIVGFPVNPNDSITATVTYQTGSQYVMTIANNTRRVYYTVPASYSRISNAQRSSAEWIAEAPYLNGILPLAHFSPVSFSNCYSIYKGITGPINACGSMSEPINMVGVGNRIKAQPSSLNSAGNAFSVAWSNAT
jgi:hypothetical protein